MEQKSMAPPSIRPIEELLVEADRFNEIFLRNLGHLKEEGRELSNSLPRLTFEIEHLKKITNTFYSFFADKAREVLIQESQDLCDRLCTAFLKKAEIGLQAQKNMAQENLKTIGEVFHNQIQQEKEEMKQALKQAAYDAQETVQLYTTEIEKFKQEAENITSTMKKNMTIQKRTLTRTGLLICVVFCTASVLTGSGLFYFFPQTLHYQDLHTAQHTLMGKVTWENLKNLSLKDQDLLLESLKRQITAKK